MYRMGIIAESLCHKELIDEWSDNIVNEKIQEVSDDEEPIWHTYELHSLESEIEKVIELLKYEVKET